MKVYVVQQWEYPDGDGSLDIIGVFSSQEKADIFILKAKEANILMDYKSIEDAAKDGMNIHEYKNAFEVTEEELDDESAYLDGFNSSLEPVKIEALSFDDLIQQGIID